MALLNAMMHVIVAEGLVDEAFIAAAPRATRRCARTSQGFNPEAMAPICGIDAETLREVARLYARAARR